MNHPVFCNLCDDRASKGGVTRVRNLLVFHFCNCCNTTKRAECDALMDRLAGAPGQSMSEIEKERAAA
jgi:hypothetical protein